MINLSERISEALKSSKRISEADIQKALAVYLREGGHNLRDVLLRMNLVSEKELASLLSVELKIPFMNLSKYKIDPEIGKIIPEKMTKQHRMIPISKIGDTITLAMADPLNIFATDDIALMTRSKIECVMSTDKDILEAIDRLYGSGTESMREIAQSVETADDVQVVKGEDDLDTAFSAAKSDEAPIRSEERRVGKESRSR